MKYLNVLEAYREDVNERIQYYNDKNKENDDVYQNIKKVNDKLYNILQGLSNN